MRLLALTLLLFLTGCSVGPGTLLPEVTIGVPTVWLLHEEFSGTVLDISSCVFDEDKDGRPGRKRADPATCSAVPFAEVTITVGGGKEPYRASVQTDGYGNFAFARKTDLRLVSRYPNRYDYGQITVTAPGFPRFTETVGWGPSTSEHTVYFDTTAKLDEKNLVLILRLARPSD